MIGRHLNKPLRINAPGFCFMMTVGPRMKVDATIMHGAPAGMHLAHARTVFSFSSTRTKKVGHRRHGDAADPGGAT